MSHNSGQVAFVRAPVARLNLQARFVGMAGAGRVTLKLTTSEDNMQLFLHEIFARVSRWSTLEGSRMKH